MTWGLKAVLADFAKVARLAGVVLAAAGIRVEKQPAPHTPVNRANGHPWLKPKQRKAIWWASKAVASATGPELPSRLPLMLRRGILKVITSPRRSKHAFAHRQSAFHWKNLVRR
ncbi:hypothetical protein ACFMBG_15500 [Leisingera sp. D0M16]|uniref:hypothetical protein n=1 Tax=Leisingera coralii TaxID=3351347 RepID=UPI003B80E2B8